jgi:threonylcarbamoyladenosine tRNA methylthiotransferase MtaB
MSVFLTSLGCRLNEAELQTWANEFMRVSLPIVSDVSDAQLIVMNTCAVTKEAARKSRQAIRRLHRKNPSAKMLVTGCYAALEPKEAKQLLGVDWVVLNQDKNQLVHQAKALLEWNTMPFAATEPHASALFIRNKERAFIKIQDGCRYRCTYCIVTIARGDEVSRKMVDILDEIIQLTTQGVQEIVLTGVHVGGYGSDIQSSFYELVVAILKETRIPRIRFASVEPWDLSQDFFELFHNSRLMPHMHLPLQSGSNRLLKKMSRRCQTESFLDLVNNARAVVPDFNITTDMIVGFPDEQEEDFNASNQLIKTVGFGHVHIFSYSKREGTKAATLPNQIEPTLKKQRSQSMHQIALDVKLKQLFSMQGKVCDILWEGSQKITGTNSGDLDSIRYYGYTPHYHKVFMDTAPHISLKNTIMSCKILSVDGLRLKVVSNDK